MQVFLEKDEPRVLPIPYHTPGEPGRRFWNLKKEPALARMVSELRGCPELRKLVIGINAASRLSTLGCAHWTKPDDLDESAVEAGLYVDLVFDRLETAAKRTRYLDVVRRLKKAAKPGRGVTIIRVQLQRVAFRAIGKKAWLLSTWVFGGGRTTAIAKARRRKGVEIVGKVCAEVSRELSEERGRRGTPVPP